MEYASCDAAPARDFPPNIKCAYSRRRAILWRGGLLALDLFGRLDHDPSAVEVDRRNDRLRERQEQGLPAALGGNFENVARPVIADLGHPPERLATRGHRFEPDEIGMVIYLRARRRQPVPANEQ